MNRILRRSPCRKSVALLSLVPFLLAAWLTVVHGSLAEGGVCPAEFGVPTAHDGLTISYGQGASAHHDCDVCRSLQSLRSITRYDPLTLAVIAPSGFIRPVPSGHQGYVALAQIPARSPPA
jgi:hypothetical protein